MIEVKKIYNVYEYDELNKKIKEKLLEKEIDNCIEDYCEFTLEEDMTYKAKELLKKYFEGNANFESVNYDLSYRQGSGAMIEFSGSYCGKSFKIKNTGGYCHEYSFIIESEQSFTDKQEQLLKHKIINMNEELKIYGYKLLNPECFEHIATENLNGKKFLENGTIFE